MMEMIKNAEDRNVIEYSAIRLIREHLEKNDRYTVEIIDNDRCANDVIPAMRELKVRVRSGCGRENDYFIVHNRFEGNSVSVFSDTLANVPKAKETAALRAINAFNFESCSCLVMTETDEACSRIRMTDYIPENTADADVGRVAEDMILLLEEERERAEAALADITFQ